MNDSSKLENNLDVINSKFEQITENRIDFLF